MKLASTTIALVLLLLLFDSPSPSEALTCDDVLEYLHTCITYLKGGVDTPDASCCNGAKGLVNAAKSVDDKRNACNCIKATAQSIQPKPGNAKSLPDKCGIKLPFEISPSLDCSKIG